MSYRSYNLYDIYLITKRLPVDYGKNNIILFVLFNLFISFIAHYHISLIKILLPDQHSPLPLLTPINYHPSL